MTIEQNEFSSKNENEIEKTHEEIIKKIEEDLKITEENIREIRRKLEILKKINEKKP